MKESTELGSMHLGGVHGTSVSAAEQIAREGFRTTVYNINFAPVHNFGFAADHGRRRAQEAGDDEYAIVQAAFPRGFPLELGLGGDQLNIPPELADKLRVVSIVAYGISSLRSRRIFPPSAPNETN